MFYILEKVVPQGSIGAPRLGQGVGPVHGTCAVAQEECLPADGPTARNAWAIRPVGLDGLLQVEVARLARPPVRGQPFLRMTDRNDGLVEPRAADFAVPLNRPAEP